MITNPIPDPEALPLNDEVSPMITTSSSYRQRRSSRGSSLLLAALIAVAAVILSGCTPARDVGSPSSTPTNGGSVTFAIAVDALPSGEFQTLNRNNSWIQNVFQPIMTIAAPGQAPKPLLATKWQLSANKLSLDITLRKDVTFQTGRPMTADDVKYSIAQSITPLGASNLGNVAKSFTAVTVVSPTELTITVSSPQASLYDYLAQTRIVDKDTYAGIADGSKVIGTGPYMFTDWKPGASFTLKKYAGYWDAKDVHLDTIHYIVTTDATAELTALRSGRAQLASGLTAVNAQSFATNKQYHIVDSGDTIYPFGMNTTVAPFNNVKVRQAVALALDATRVNKQIFADSAYQSNVMWAKGAPGITSALTNKYDYDLATAKKMIQAAGATGAAVPVEYGANPVVRAIYEIVANNLTAIGLVPSAKVVDQPTFSAGQLTGDLGTAFISLHVVTTPATMLNALPTLRKGNPSKFYTPEYDSLRTAYLGATTSTSSTTLQALSKYMVDQAFLVPIVQAPDRIVVSSSVQGVSTVMGGPILLQNAYVTK